MFAFVLQQLGQGKHWRPDMCGGSTSRGNLAKVKKGQATRDPRWDKRTASEGLKAGMAQSVTAFFNEDLLEGVSMVFDVEKIAGLACQSPTT